MSELASRPSPVSGAERIVALDVLRGVAILGILVMNVQSFAMPFAAYSNPHGWGGEPTAVDLLVWAFAHLFAEQKFMTLFSILFGAGAALMLDRLQAKGLPAARVHYRRMGGLILIGAAHGYLLWYGDILFGYGVCGLLLYPFRNVRPARLLAVGFVVLCVAPAIGQGFGLYLSQLPAEQQAELMAGMVPSDEAVAYEVETYRQGWLAQMRHRVPTSLAFQTVFLLLFTFWRALGLMLVGMALYRWAVITAGRSPGLYRRLALWGFGLGLPICVAGLLLIVAREFDFQVVWLVAGVVNYLGSLGVSLGYLALVMLWCLSEAPSAATAAVRRSLAAVGRMALTNYLLQTVLCVFVFYGGLGLGLFGHVSRLEQWLVVLAVWGFQLLVSPWWLERFRFGPAEWLWRTMTYLRPQPMRRSLS